MKRIILSFLMSFWLIFPLESKAISFGFIDAFEKQVEKLDRRVREAKEAKKQPTVPVNRPPYSPSSPIPMDGATNVGTTPTLSWAGGGPDGDTVVYDAYFGTETSPSLRSNDQSETTYSPGTLLYNTLYYWKVVASDNHGSATEGPVWIFRTMNAPAQQNNPPNAASNPNPANGATGVGTVGVTLSWQCSDPDNDPLTYDVYFETNDSTPDILVSAGQGATSFVIVGTLQYSTTYYWQIISRDNKGSSTGGPVWSFTTQPQPAPAPKLYRLYGTATTRFAGGNNPLPPGSPTIEIYFAGTTTNGEAINVWYEENTRRIRGKAWSPYFGWLSFEAEDVQNPPRGHPHLAQITNENIDGGNKEVIGWVRLLDVIDADGEKAWMCLNNKTADWHIRYYVTYNETARSFDKWSWLGAEILNGYVHWGQYYGPQYGVFMDPNVVMTESPKIPRVLTTSISKERPRDWQVPHLDPVP